MSDQMKAIIYKSYGNIETLEMAEIPKPKIRSHEVLIEIHASSVNPIDWKLRRGDLKMLIPLKLPAIPGFDLSGKIIEAGSDVTGFAVGDEVYSRSNKNPGMASAEFIALDPACIAVKPKKLDFQQSAAIPLAGLTALQAFRDKGNLQPGQRVLVNGASGGVGVYAVQIAKALGAHVTAVCGTSNIDMVKKLGSDHVIDYRSQNPLTVDGTYNMIFDAAASLSYSKASKKLEKSGVYISTVPKITRILKSTVGNMIFSKKETYILMKPSGDDLKQLADLADEGKLISIIDSVFPLIDLKRAHKLSESGRARGKIIISIK